MKAAIYCRVSTEEQARSGYSIPDQIAKCTKKAYIDGATEVIEYIDDGYSGEFMERPALDALRNDIRSDIIKLVVVYDLDRLSRETDHLLILVKEIERKAKLVFVTNEYAKTPAGELFMTLHAGIAKYEKSMIKERTTRGKRQKALSGKLTHNDRPLGYDFDSINSMYIINDAEAATVRKIFELYISNRYGFHKLAADINSLGARTKKGNRFDNSAVDRIIGNEMYCGTKWAYRRYEKKTGQNTVRNIIRDRSEWIPISVPAIIDRETWEQAQIIRRENKKNSLRNTKHEYLVKNIVRCGLCGRAMTGYSCSTYGRTYYYYRCTGITEHPKCKARLIPSDELDEYVWSKLLQAAKSGNINQLVPQQQMNTIDYTAILADLKQRKAAITKWVADGDIEIEAAGKQLKQLNDEIAIIQQKINSSTNERKEIDPLKIIQAKTFDKKRAALLSSGFKISVSKNNNCINYKLL